MPQHDTKTITRAVFDLREMYPDDDEYQEALAHLIEEIRSGGDDEDEDDEEEDEEEEPVEMSSLSGLSITGIERSNGHPLLRLGGGYELSGDGNPWQAYTGSRGGRGWKNAATGRVMYQESRPSAHESGGVEEEHPLAHSPGDDGVKEAHEAGLPSASAHTEERANRDGLSARLTGAVKIAAAAVASAIVEAEGGFQGKIGAAIGQATAPAVQKVKTIFGKLWSSFMGSGKPKKEESIRWRAAKRAVSAVAWLVMAADHKLEEYTKHAGSSLAEELAIERGMSPEKAQALRTALATEDAMLAWTVNIPVVHQLLHMAHIEGVAGFALSKVGYYVPVSSLCYIARATLGSAIKGDPLAILRAARNMLTGRKKGITGHDHAVPDATPPAGAQLSTQSSSGRRQTAEDLADFLEGVTDHDMALALVMVGMDMGGSLASGVSMAREAALSAGGV